ncbi:MAG: rhodanese-like domain-containing protein [Sulfuricaulis sp.]
MSRTVSPNDIKALRVHHDVMVIDVRRKNNYDADSQKLPGAVWRNPEEIALWSETLPKDKEVVVYCVRGGSVSNAVIDHLLGQQISARFIEGGTEAWKSAGGQTVGK